MNRQQDAPASPDRSELEQQLDTLQRDIRRLQLEKDLLKKANELLKKELSIDRQDLTNREKTQLVDALRPTYAVVQRCADQDLTRLPQSRRASQEPGDRCLTSPSFWPHPQWVNFRSAPTPWLPTVHRQCPSPGAPPTLRWVSLGPWSCLPRRQPDFAPAGRACNFGTVEPEALVRRQHS